MTRKFRAQRRGGQLLAQIKRQLVQAAKPGTRLEHLDSLAEKLLLQTGGQPSFKMVAGYQWSTCININDGVVHGIPKGTLTTGDLVTIDVGLYYQGFHTDTSTSFIVGRPSHVKQALLDVGAATLVQAIAAARPGKKIWDISQAIQLGVESAGFAPVRTLTGHGVSKNLHENPAIPCYVEGSREFSPTIKIGDSLAIEVIFAAGSGQTTLSPDGWTIATKDGSLSAVFEETVLITQRGPEVVTATLEKTK